MIKKTSRKDEYEPNLGLYHPHWCHVLIMHHLVGRKGNGMLKPRKVECSSKHFDGKFGWLCCGSHTAYNHRFDGW